ncbi:nucleotide-binding protein [Micrococcus sp.]|uniref:nucleotide-binding protein n=1 Tax=Micrococcus sp. TaxID=1271 RepID=UPI002A917196|nr:nucleotide-binding protein [Micrococcus sp.]MDY6055031.1 nucleotide-binding protein [Micrococcus sp.]
MKEEEVTYVFDTGPLRHFTLNNWLGVLKFLTRGRVVIPESVERELKDQSHQHQVLQQVLTAEWIVVDRSDDLEYLAAFAAYEEHLVEDGRNRGECGVLALGRVRGHRIVIDDNVPRRLAKEEHLDCTGTLGLLCHAIREGQLTVPLVESLADDLIMGEYRLPFPRGGFRRWAEEQGLLTSRPR